MLLGAFVVIFLMLAILAHFRGWDWGAVELVSSLLIVSILLLLAVTAILNGMQVTHRTEIERLTASQAIIQDRIGNVLSQVTNELSKYPQYEERVLKSVGGAGKGQLIVVPPELKANATIMQAAAKIEEYNNLIYDNRQKIVDQEYVIKLNVRVGRWFVPWVTGGG